MTVFIPPFSSELQTFLACSATGDEDQNRLIGVDLGTKTIGLALSDLSRRLATPFQTLRRRIFREDAKKFLEICALQNVSGIVIGLPLNMNGTEGPRVQSVRAFVRNLSALTALPFFFWDERLSTAAVTRILLEANLSRAKRAAVVDRAAAAFILQGFLDHIHTHAEISGKESEKSSLPSALSGSNPGG